MLRPLELPDAAQDAVGRRAFGQQPSERGVAKCMAEVGQDLQVYWHARRDHDEQRVDWPSINSLEVHRVVEQE